MPFVPHTPDDVSAMLATIGASSIDELFDEIPTGLLIDRLEGVPAGLGEQAITRLMHARASRLPARLCFLGAGAYEHHIPAAVWELATRGEFYSAYTPYQAEASQGTLQVTWEYQSMMASLTGLDVSNASLYDGATAFAEACLMAVRANRSGRPRRILVSRYLHPAWLDVARTIVAGQQIELCELPARDGRSDAAALAGIDAAGYCALAVQQPNFLGALEPVDELARWARHQGLLVIGACNPVALAILKPPGEWGDEGADIACGEGQPLGIPLSGGGPYFGYMTCRQSLVRQMPGRIVGRTLDRDGRPGFTLTLQAREQHIRRSRSTSNICTNQGLMVTAATIYLSLLGAEGLRRVALRCHANTRRLVDALTALPGVSLLADGFFHEVVFGLDQPVAPLLEKLAGRGIVGGLDVSAQFPEFGHALLVCATETRTPEDIALYARTLGELLAPSAESREHDA